MPNSTGAISSTATCAPALRIWLWAARTCGLVAGDTPGKHLWVEDKKTTLVLERLLEDYCAGWETIIARLMGGTLRVKAFGGLRGGVMRSRGALLGPPLR